MRNNKIHVRLTWYIWIYPILLFLVVLYGFVDSGGTDFDRQLGSLRSCEKENWTYMFNYLLENRDQSGLYHIVYNFLHNYIGISPRLYIALILFAYFGITIYIMFNYYSNDSIQYLNKKKLSLLSIFTILCFCPIFFTISRNFCAVTFIYIGVFFMIKRRYVIALIPIILAYFVHEGVLIIYSILIFGAVLYFFWLRKSKNYFIRNLLIIAISVSLLILGGTLFSSITSYWFDYGLLSEHYFDTYGTQRYGDGNYKLVIVLSMLGPLICLFVNSLIDKRNNLIYGITVAGLFAICLLYNQKIFLVQRIMIFMPVFIGLTSYQIFSDYKKEQKEGISYQYIMLLVPFNLLFQFIIQFNMYFGNFF